MNLNGRSARTAVAAVLATCVGGAMSLPFLVLGVGGIDQPVTVSCTSAATTEAPSILGPGSLDASELATWWRRTGHGQPSRLAISINALISLYVDEGQAEGVRGDLAFAQSVHETGYFTSPDTQRNNFAGIGHVDGATSGHAFANPQTGVRAHIQLLKKFALGNDAPLASPVVAPDAAARATDWADLAGTWASDPGYWVSLSRLFTAILDDAGRCGATDTASAIAPGELALTAVHGITVNTAVAGRLGAMLNAAQADGLILSGAGYRSHERQIELRRAHCGTSSYAIYEMPSSQCSPPTARPGASMHEQGLAVDFANCSSRSTRCWQWLNTNAAAYGLFNLPSEPWHWSTSGA